MRIDRPSRPSRDRWTITILVVVAALASIVGVALAGPSPQRTAGVDADGRVQAVADEMTDRLLEREARLRSPEARAERRRSRSLFGGLSKSDALGLGEQRFSDALAGDVWTGLDLRDGEQLDRYLGEFAARVTRPGKPKAIVESSVPMRAVDENGKKAPVELALEDRGGFLESENPLVPVEFSKDPAEGVTLRRSGVGVSLAGVDARAAGVEAGDRLAVADALEDTDLWTMPTAGGFETFTVLRSAESPEQIAFDVDLPAGAELRQRPGGGAAVVRDGERIAMVSTPFAHDSDGEPVAVDMAVEGSRLVLDVPHRQADLRYPVLVDPEFVEEWDWYLFDDAPYGWEGYTNHSGTFDWAYSELPQWWDAGLYVFTHTGATVNSGDYGGWKFDPPGDSYAYRAEFEASTNALSACMYRGLSDGYNSPLSNCSAVNFNTVTACKDAACSPDQGTNGNWAYMRLQSTTTSTRTDPTKAIASLAYAQVRYSDRNVPSFAGVNTGGTGSIWKHSYVGDVTGNVTDSGVGMLDVILNVAGEDVDGRENLCTGTGYDPCPSSLNTGISINSDNPPLDDPFFEGKHSVVLKADDALGKQASTTWGTYWIDRDGPSLALSGSVWDGRIQTPPGTALTPSASHNLHIVATDGVQGGTASQRRSGVKSVEVQVDGNTVLAPNSVSCPPASTDSCPSTRDYTLSTAEFAAGTRTVTVIAKDQIGHTTTQSFDVIIPPAGELLTPQNGNSTSRWLQLQAHADRAGLNTVRFQYKRPLMGWQDIPQNALFNAQGLPVSTLDHAITSGNSPVISWDVPITWALLGAQPGPIDIRAKFAESSGPGGSSKTVRVNFDPRGLGAPNATSEIGPGSVDLLTGNFNYSTVDASVSGLAQNLSVTRTFNSRDPGVTTNGPFGPGWVTSIPVAGAAEYSAVTEINDAVNGTYVEVTGSDGSKSFFEPKSGGGYQGEVGLEEMTLTKPASDRFQLNDSSGNSSLFVHQTGAPTNRYDLTQVTQPGSGNKGTVTYDFTTGKIRWVIAPSSSSVTCTFATLDTKGCRSLTFTYATSTTATGTAEANWGNYNGRLQRIDFKAWDTSSVTTTAVAQYLYDNTGKLRASWDPRISPALKERYAYDAGGRLSQITPAGTPTWNLTYQQLVGDADGGRLKSASRTTPQGTATSTIAYGVAVSGLAAPYQMGESDVAAWSQDDYPVDATAVFPPDQVPANPPTSFSRATLHYMNRSGREVNSISPGGAIETSEYDVYGNATRELSAGGHARAMASGGLSAQTSERLDVQRTFADSGQEMVDELGPEHEVKLDSGSVVQARSHTVVAYDEGAPANTNPHKPTTSTISAQVVGGPSSADARVSKTDYNWTLLKPTHITSFHGAANLHRYFSYDSETGLPLSATMPKSGSATRYVTYYKGASGTCGSRVEWAGLPCESKLANGTNPGSLPAPAVTTFTYNRLNQVLTKVKAADGEQITTTNTYDAAGRSVTTSTAASGGPQPGLIGAYGFDEGSGTAVIDQSSSGNDGTIEGGASRVDGRFGRAIKFDGVDDRVRAPYTTTLNPATIEAWVRPDTLAGAGARNIVTRPTAATGCGAPTIGMRAYGSAALTAPGAAYCGTWSQPSNATRLPEKFWTHVAVVRSGATIKVFVNGVEKSSTPVSGSNSSLGDFLIGDGPGGLFSGLIDEVRFYSTALSASQIVTDMHTPVDPNAGNPVIPAQGSQLRAAYGFEEGFSSTTIRDSSPNGNNGALSSTPGYGTRSDSARDGGAISGQVTVPDSASLDLTTAATVESWVLPTSFAQLNSVVSKGGSYSLVATNIGTPTVTFNVQVGGVSKSVAATISATAATHVTGTFDGTTVRIYTNGVLASSLAASGSITTNNTPLTLGSLATNNPATDEVRIYARALNATEIQADADALIAPPYKKPGNGVAVPTVTMGYDSTSGLPTTVSTTEDGTTRTLTTGYDTLGRTTSYADADGNSSTMTYDLLGRLTVVNDGKGTQTFSYDATTGLPTQLVDSHAGTFTAQYDKDSNQIAQTYPNGMRSDTIYNEVGSPTDLTYTKTSNCASNCIWYQDHVTESIHGQWRTRDTSLSDQVYAYDSAGRLSQVNDTGPGGQCTVRTYAYDQNSNRTSRSIFNPGAGGACDTGAADAVQNSTYDDVDRITNSGIAYDTFGRVTSLPSSHAGGSSALQTDYYVNDMVRTQSQDGVSKGWLLDPMQARYRASIPSGTTQEIMHYADSSDSPAWSEVKVSGVTQSWSRSTSGIGGDLVAMNNNNGSSTTTTLQLGNLHGDIIATASTSPTAGGLLATYQTDEFGNPKQTGTRKFSYLGGKERRTVLDSGVIQMGVRSYVPTMGRFTSTDPVTGGSANDYDYTNADPVNNMDLDGRRPKCRTYFGHAARRGVAGNTQVSISRTIEWCSRGGRIISKKAYHPTHSTPAPGWRAVGRWTIDGGGGKGHTYYHATASLSFKFCVKTPKVGPIPAIEGCPFHQTLTIDVYLYADGSCKYGPTQTGRKFGERCA